MQQRSQKFYEAVEKGLLPMDSTLTERANKLQAQRQALLTEIARLRRLRQMPAEALGEKKYRHSRRRCVSDCLVKTACSARST